MGSDTPQTRTLKRALEIAGGTELLTTMLACDAPSLASWLSGDLPTPPEVYLRALDIVSGRLQRRPPGTE
jgi:hypothetical protein